MAEHIIVPSLTFIIMTFGAFANLLVLQSAKKMSSMSSSFGIITKSQALCNLLMCLVFLLCVCPMQLFDISLLLEHSNFFGLAAMSVYEASNQLHLLLSVNRLCAVFWPYNYDSIFNKRNTILIRNLAWLIGITMCIILYEFVGCYFSYDAVSWTFGFLNSPKCTRLTWISDFLFNSSLVAFTLIFNLLTAYKSGKDNRNLLSAAGMQMSKQNLERERRFMRQSFFQGISMFAGQVTYYLTAPLIQNPILLFVVASLWAFMHAFEGFNGFRVCATILTRQLSYQLLDSIESNKN